MDHETLTSRLLEIVDDLNQKLPYAYALVTSDCGLNVTFSPRQQSVSEDPPSRGAVLVAYDGQSFGEVATADLSPGGLWTAARRLASLGLGPGPVKVAHHLPLRGSYTNEVEIDPATVPLEDKIDLARQLCEQGRALDQRVVDCQALYAESQRETLYVGPGRVLYQRLHHARAGVTLIVSNGRTTAYDYEFSQKRGGFEAARLQDDQWPRLAANALALLDAEKVPPGEYDVIASPQVAGLIAHEAFGHGVELDMFVKGRAKAAAYLGKRVGSELVDLYDDPTYPGGPGSYFFDDEGQPASRTTILKAGMFLQGLSDLYSWDRLGGQRTANGRRESYAHKTYARMSNTFFGPGPHSLEEMIACTKHGVYLGRFQSGMEDPKGWGVQCICLWGREILDGQLTGRYFSPVALTGYVPDLLSSVSMVAGDLELFPGGCGKGHKETVMVGLGGPHLKLKARLG